MRTVRPRTGDWSAKASLEVSGAGAGVDASVADAAGRWLQLRAATASSEIVAQMRGRLFRGELVPGQFLGTERSLAAEFGVARLTMRDALRILEANGIITVKVGKTGGVRVAEPNAERFADALAVQLVLAGISFVEVFEAQMGVEAQAARLAAQRAEEADIARMADILERLEAAVEDVDVFPHLSLDFHAMLVAASRNRALIAKFQALRHLSARVVVVKHSPERARRVLARHKLTFDAVVAHDQAGAAASVIDHLHAIIKSHTDG